MTGILTKLLLVMIGGSLGALCRYGVSLAAIRLFGAGLSWGTFTANMIGCFLIGVLFALADRWTALTPAVRLFLMTGFLGALTTFSTYALETVDAARSGRLAEAALTVAANNLGGIVLVMSGITVVQILYRGR
ncbi:MAG: fluoride efflux transporter CrcB [Desulfobacterales bacterium]